MPALVLALLLLATPASGATIVLDFEEEALGYYEPGFVSVECSCVRVSDFAGHELAVFDFYLGTRVVSPGWKNEGGDLLLEFLVPVVGLSLDFLSFYPWETDRRPIDYFDAHLIAYAGGEIVGETTLTPDPTGPLFQTISLFPGTVIEEARFVRVALGFHEPISPFVDNIVLTTVPEPSSLSLGFAALAIGCAVGRRARRRAKLSLRALGVVFALLLLAAPASGATIVIDFEAEPLAIYDDGEPFQPAGCGGCVELAEELRRFGYLDVHASVFGGTVLTVGEEGGALRITFLVPVTAFSLDFGGDSDSPHIRADPAGLRGFAGGVEVAFDELAPNRNRLVDQTLTIAPGVVMDYAVFFFQQLGEHEPASPTVDNLVLTTVPEPGTLGLLALVLVVVASQSVASTIRPREARRR